MLLLSRRLMIKVLQYFKYYSARKNFVAQFAINSLQFALFPAEFLYAFHVIFWETSLNNFVCLLYPFFIYAWAFGFWNLPFLLFFCTPSKKKKSDTSGWNENELTEQ